MKKKVLSDIKIIALITNRKRKIRKELIEKSIKIIITLKSKKIIKIRSGNRTQKSYNCALIPLIRIEHSLNNLRLIKEERQRELL